MSTLILTSVTTIGFIFAFLAQMLKYSVLILRESKLKRLLNFIWNNFIPLDSLKIVARGRSLSLEKRRSYSHSFSFFFYNCKLWDKKWLPLGHAQIQCCDFSLVNFCTQTHTCLSRRLTQTSRSYKRLSANLNSLCSRGGTVE